MPPKKPFKSKFKLILAAGAATPAPPVGPILGQHGVMIPQFVKQFNDHTADLKGSGLKVPVICYVFEDRTFQLEFKSPPASDLIKQALGIKSGSGVPNKEKVGKITRAQLEEIATRKMADLNANDMDAAVNIILGSCRQMGVELAAE